MEFLKEYCAVLKPLSRGLDILQGEDNCYYGALLPTLGTIIKNQGYKARSINDSGSGRYCRKFYQKRFRKVFDSKDAIIAAVTSPKFKVKWVESQKTKDRYKQLLLDELRLLEDVIVENTIVVTKEKNQDFYELESDYDQSGANSREISSSAAGIKSPAIHNPVDNLNHLLEWVANCYH